MLHSPRSPLRANHFLQLVGKIGHLKQGGGLIRPKVRHCLDFPKTVRGSHFQRMSPQPSWEEHGRHGEGEVAENLTSNLPASDREGGS